MLSWLKSLFTSHSEMEASEFIPRELGPGDRFLSKSSAKQLRKCLAEIEQCGKYSTLAEVCRSKSTKAEEVKEKKEDEVAVVEKAVSTSVSVSVANESGSRFSKKKKKHNKNASSAPAGDAVNPTWGKGVGYGMGSVNSSTNWMTTSKQDNAKKIVKILDGVREVLVNQAEVSTSPKKDDESVVECLTNSRLFPFLDEVFRMSWLDIEEYGQAAVTSAIRLCDKILETEASVDLFTAPVRMSDEQMTPPKYCLYRQLLSLCEQAKSIQALEKKLSAVGDINFEVAKLVVEFTSQLDHLVKNPSECLMDHDLHAKEEDKSDVEMTNAKDSLLDGKTEREREEIAEKIKEDGAIVMEHSEPMTLVVVPVAAAPAAPAPPAVEVAPAPLPPVKVEEVKGEEVKVAPADEYVQKLSDLRLAYVDKFTSHHFPGGIKPQSKFVRRVLSEYSDMSTSLPVSRDSSVFLRVCENDISKSKMLIIGPTDTPYAGGCFLFDVFLPELYPEVPPQVNLCTTGNSSVRFNPNLYNCGKVCLSLLGTWSGGQSENWNPKCSTLLQVAISIQSLILVPHPYFNEPGYVSQLGSPVGKTNSDHYNRVIERGTLQWAMVDMLEKPPVGFEEIVRTHFKLNRDRVLKQVEAWNQMQNNAMDVFVKKLKPLLEALD